MAPGRRRESAREHLGAVHRSADRDLVADGGHSADRGGRLSASAGGTAAAGRFPNHPGHGAIAGRQPRDDGFVGGNAARASIRPDSWRYSNDLDERARQHGGHRPVRSQSRHRRGGTGCPGGDQCGRRAAAEEPAQPADLSQGQSGGFADSDLRRPFRRAAAHRRRRLCREHSRSADLADHRRRPGQCRRAAEAGGPRPGRSRQDRGAGHRSRGGGNGDRLGHCRHSEGQHRRRAAEFCHLRQRSDPQRCDVERCGRDLQ